MKTNGSRLFSFPRAVVEGRAGKPKSEVFPIPIREDVVVRIELPVDLTSQEADRIANVIKALATGSPNSMAIPIRSSHQS